LLRLLCACTASRTEHCIDTKMAKTCLTCLLTLLSTQCEYKKPPDQLLFRPVSLFET
ncbi:hypothetical protein GOODEAATRI_026709, partial [Goodea atripinnis]